MRYPLTLILLILLWFSSTSYAQKNIFDCVGYNMLLHPEDGYEGVFQPELMKRLKNKHLTYVAIDTARDTTYRVAQFRFGEHGYMIQRNTYYRGYSHIYSGFERDSLHQVIKKTTGYFDENGQLSEDFLPATIRSFVYNQHNILVAEISTKNNEVTATETYEYDGNGRTIRLISSYGFTETYSYDGNQSLLSEEHYFEDDSLIRITTYTYDKQSRLIETIGVNYNTNAIIYRTVFDYDHRGNLVEETLFWNGENTPSRSKKWTYNKRGQKTSFIVDGIPEGECPDLYNLEESYHYNAKGVLKKIIYRFGDHRCVVKLKMNDKITR